MRPQRFTVKSSKVGSPPLLAEFCGYLWPKFNHCHQKGISDSSVHHRCNLNTLNKHLSDCWFASYAKFLCLHKFFYFYDYDKIYEKVAGEVSWSGQQTSASSTKVQYADVEIQPEISQERSKI